MARLVDADQVLQFIESDMENIPNNEYGLYLLMRVYNKVKEQPTIDPVKHGKWVKLDGDWKNSETGEPLKVHHCSVCGTCYMYAPYNYCPHCGAKMDKGE